MYNITWWTTFIRSRLIDHAPLSVIVVPNWYHVLRVIKLTHTPDFFSYVGPYAPSTPYSSPTKKKSLKLTQRSPEVIGVPIWCKLKSSHHFFLIFFFSTSFFLIWRWIMSLAHLDQSDLWCSYNDHCLFYYTW